MPARTISTDQVQRLISTLGLPLAAAGIAGFHTRAFGGHSGTQPVKTATVVLIGWTHAGGARATAADLDSLPDVRDHYQALTAVAGQHSYQAVWRDGSAVIEISRSHQNAEGGVTPFPSSAAVRSSTVIGMTLEEYEDRRRRLEADAEEARKALRDAQARFDKICADQRTLWNEWQQRPKERQ